MPLRSCRFYLFGHLHYYEHIRLPQHCARRHYLLGDPTFMCYLISARNHILPRMFHAVSCHYIFQHSSRFHQLRETDQHHLRNEA